MRYYYKQNNYRGNYCEFCKKPCGKYKWCKECYSLIKNQKKEQNSYGENIPIVIINHPQNHSDKRLSTYITKNGLTVKSKSECLIADFLYLNGIEFSYEKPLYCKSAGTTLHPDFYIHEATFSKEKNPIKRLFKKRKLEHVYIEHLGGSKSNDPKDQEKYKETTNYKIPIYHK